MFFCFLGADEDRFVVELQYVGDDSLCVEWQKGIIDRSVLKGNFSFADSTDIFFVSIYSFATQKRKNITSVDMKEFESAFLKANVSYSTNEVDIADVFDEYFCLLIFYMDKYGYCFVSPKHAIYPYNDKNEISKKIELYLCKKYLTKILKRVNPGKTLASFLYYKCIYNTNILFIKYYLEDFDNENEFIISDILYSRNKNNFIKPFFYESSEHRFIAFQYMHLMPIDVNKLQISKTFFIEELVRIYTTLQESGIVHRDGGLHNMFLSENGRVLLGDMQHAVIREKHKEKAFLANDLRLLRKLHGKYSFWQYSWSNAEIFIRTLKQIGRDESCALAYDAAYSLF